MKGTELEEPWIKRRDGWEHCGWSTLYRNTQTGTVVGLPDHCDRIACQYCELRRLSKIRDRYRARHDEALAGDRLYLATLTIPNVPIGELDAALDTLRDAIARLRRQSWWKSEVVGGVWRLEVTVNRTERTWHPHANLLFETSGPIRMADWQPQLQAAWRAALGETEGQWIWLSPGWVGSLPEAIKRQVAAGAPAQPLDDQTGRTSIDYTLKPDPHWIDPGDPVWVVEYVEALSGRRSVSSFGGWRRLEAAADDRDTVPAEELVVAPYAAGDDYFTNRYLPALDPLTDTPATWVFYGRGPRHALRPHRPPGEGRREWLVWSPADETADPAYADDDRTPAYQASLRLERAA